jgi:sialidase-1
MRSLRSIFALAAIVLASLVGLTAPASAAEPLLETSVVFQAGQGGYESYRIPCLAATAKGTLLAFCEARRGTTGDWGSIDLLMRRSTDSGATWSAQRKIAAVEGPLRKNPLAVARNLARDGEVTYNNPLAIVDRTGSIHFLFCLEYMRAFCQRSDDDGQSFSAPVEITPAFEAFRKQYDWKVLAAGPGHGIQLASGRLLAPVWLSTGAGGHAHRPSVVATIFSDDSGRMWQAGEIVAHDDQPLANPSESMAVELVDGRVMLNMRSESPEHRRATATSPNGATGWTRPAFDQQLLEPICMASLCRLSLPSVDGKGRILFANPDNLERADGKAIAGRGRDRKNLSVKLSYDEGRTWPVSRVLDGGPSGYSDLAVGPDHSMYCLYEQGGREAASAFRPSLSLARFNLEWLTAGQDSLPASPPVSKR